MTNSFNGFICRALSNGKFESVNSFGTTLSQQLKDDKKFGFLKPTNGVLRYKILNFDSEITEKQTRRAVALAFLGWGLYTPIRFKRTRAGESADITIEFKSEENDEILDSNTLAYMYYPVGGKNDGECVVNTRFYWTNHGNGIDMHYIDPVHYPTTKSTNPIGKTYDLDQILRHEFGHGVFGLPHSQREDKIMSSNERFMSEHLTSEDIVRSQAKAGIRTGLRHRWQLLMRWYRKRSDS